MGHLADLHEAGYLLAAGPLDYPQLRGLSILNVDVERAREMKEQDPAVRIGRFSVQVMPSIVPGGALAFSPARFPRTMADTLEPWLTHAS